MYLLLLLRLVSLLLFNSVIYLKQALPRDLLTIVSPVMDTTIPGSEAAESLTEYGFSPGELDFFVFLRQQDRG